MLTPPECPQSDEASPYGRKWHHGGRPPRGPASTHGGSRRTSGPALGPRGTRGPPRRSLEIRRPARAGGGLGGWFVPPRKREVSRGLLVSRMDSGGTE